MTYMRPSCQRAGRGRTGGRGRRNAIHRRGRGPERRFRYSGPRLLGSIGASLVLIATATGCSGQAAAPQVSVAPAAIDSARVVGDLRYLSSPALEGRATGTPGNALAREYIVEAFAAAGLVPFEGGIAVPFTLGGREGVNVVGYVPGSERAGRYIAVTAHYDHLGVRDGEIYHGADDNASGTAALLELARHFAAPANRPEHTLVFAALDAEEGGLRGARAFVADPPVPRDSILLNVNMDMISRNAAGEIYVAGTFHYPFLGPLVDAVAARSELTVLRGHDRPGVPGMDDWTGQSDHGAFHDAGIPFLYFGVEDHPDYHRPTDTFENTDPGFFVDAVETVLDLIRVADERQW